MVNKDEYNVKSRRVTEEVPSITLSVSSLPQSDAAQRVTLPYLVIC